MQHISTARSESQILATNKVLRNTYALLSMTLLFSAATAGISMVMNLPFFNPILTLVGYFGLLFATTKFRNSSLGLLFVFMLTGFMGLTLGPILNAYLATANGGQLVMTALGGTGVIFLALSGYALTSRKDFSFMGGFLMVGLFVVLGAALLNIFMGWPALFLAVNAGIVLIMSGLILYETSAIIHGGETNYIMATASLFLSILNLFQALLHLLGAFSGDD